MHDEDREAARRAKALPPRTDPGRYDGRKRNPFDEAECGHHYAHAMASWAAVLALTGFHYSRVSREVAFAAAPGRHFWSNGYAWGTCTMAGDTRKGWTVTLSVAEGEITVAALSVGDRRAPLPAPRTIAAGQSATIEVR